MAEQENDITALQNSFFSLINDKNKETEEIWNLANQLQQNDKSGDYKYTTIAAYAVVDRDPKFQPQTMFALIANSANQGYVDMFTGDADAPSSEIASYSADAKALSSLAKNNPDIASSSVLLNTLNKISKEAVLSYQNGKSYDKEADNKFETFASYIVPAYAQGEYNTPEKAERALQSIEKIERNINNEYYARSSHDVINTIDSIFNKSMSYADTSDMKKIMEMALGVLNTVSPQIPEEATKMTRLYGIIGLTNQELAGESIDKIRKTFNNFANNEEIQKQCLSQLELMNNLGRSNFDEDTQNKLDLQTRLMRDRINVEQLKRINGKETTWTTDNSQRNSTNTRTYSNSDNTHDGR